ncbi:hypothetical protein QCA50_011575 [Cerrena zonata]|uniref:MYND-type domain-containing protein n=1 Tax=Cerrena zonata TaxID=2478898 RepID=A0AAW0G6A9_9APHY
MQALSECDACNKKPGNSLCSCGERAYCSETCQNADWKEHKTKCGKPDQISLERFYPFLAWMFYVPYVVPRTKPMHPAMIYKISNDANPNVPAMKLPDGSWAQLVVIDDTTAPRNILDFNLMKWFPLAQSSRIAMKLERRIQASGYLLPILTAVATSILAEMYTTTSTPAGEATSSGRSIRLTYNSMPISDFGIAAGSVDIHDQDCLAFCKTSDSTISKSQDPDDHYWIYFTTVSGEEVILDFGLFPFNECQVVNTDAYLFPGMSTSQAKLGWCPAYIIGPDDAQDKMPVSRTERKRLSMLRNPDLHKAVKLFDDIHHRRYNAAKTEDIDPVYDFMETLSGRSMSEVEKAVCKEMLPHYFYSMHYVLCPRNQEWKRFPQEPELGFDTA